MLRRDSHGATTRDADQEAGMYPNTPGVAEDFVAAQNPAKTIEGIANQALELAQHARTLGRPVLAFLLETAALEAAGSSSIGTTPSRRIKNT